MNIYVTLQNNLVKKLSEVEIGDLLLCDDGKFYPVRNVLMISCYPIYFRFSNGYAFYFSNRMKLKTLEGFQTPQLWDVVDLGEDTTPQIVSCKLLDNLMFFCDILIDGNIVTPEGLIFKYSN